MPAEPGEVVIVFDDLTEFFAVRDSIDTLIRENIVVNIVVAASYSEDMELATRSEISRLGYTVIDQVQYEKLECKILLEPYPTIFGQKIKYDYRIKYSYSASSAKPNPVFLPEWNIPYDASIMYSKRDAQIRSVYGKVHVVPYTKYKNFKRSHTTGKPNLLYLPTYGEVNSVEALDADTLKDIKKKYHLIVKAHHAIQFRSDEEMAYGSIKDMADEFYDSDTPLEYLLSQADVVLSDNSGAIFEAIYSETPVAVFSNKLNERKLGDINTFQYDLVKEGALLCAEKSTDIMKVLENTSEVAAIQKQVKYSNFVPTEDDFVADFVSVIKEYLSKDRQGDFYALSHDILKADFNEKEQSITTLTARVCELETQVTKYENSTSWKTTRPLRGIKKFARRSYGGK